MVNLLIRIFSPSLKTTAFDDGIDFRFNNTQIFGFLLWSIHPMFIVFRLLSILMVLYTVDDDTTVLISMAHKFE